MLLATTSNTISAWALGVSIVAALAAIAAALDARKVRRIEGDRRQDELAQRSRDDRRRLDETVEVVWDNDRIHIKNLTHDLIRLEVHFDPEEEVGYAERNWGPFFELAGGTGRVFGVNTVGQVVTITYTWLNSERPIRAVCSVRCVPEMRSVPTRLS